MAETMSAKIAPPMAEYGSRPALVLSICLHLGLAVSAWILARPAPPKPELPSVRVQLASLPNGGERKAVKAPVAGRQRTPPPKAAETPKAKPEPKVVPPPAKTDVGLKKKEKLEKKPEKPKTEKPEPKKPEPKKPEPKKPEPEKPRPVESSKSSSARPDADSKPPVKEPENLKIPIATGGGGGAGTPGLAMELGEPDPNVDLENGEFNTYFQVVYEKVYQRWNRGGLSSGKTKIQFHIQRNGKISFLKVLESSGKAYLDAPAQRAVQGAEFPPLPQGYLGSALIVNITFQYD